MNAFPNGAINKPHHTAFGSEWVGVRRRSSVKCQAQGQIFHEKEKEKEKRGNFV